jgi:hypothetical protein
MPGHEKTAGVAGGFLGALLREFYERSVIQPPGGAVNQ